MAESPSGCCPCGRARSKCSLFPPLWREKLRTFILNGLAQVAWREVRVSLSSRDTQSCGTRGKRHWPMAQCRLPPGSLNSRQDQCYPGPRVLPPAAGRRLAIAAPGGVMAGVAARSTALASLLSRASQI